MIIGQKARKNHHLMTIVDQKTRFDYIIKALSKNDWIVYKTLRNFIINHQIKIKSITVDNGLEFAKLGLLAKELKIKAYFANLIVRFKKVPKKTLMDLLEEPKKNLFNNITS